MEGLPDPRTDGELLVATSADPQAFAVFYRRHVRGVISFFRRRVDSPDLAFDLTAETFAATLEAAPRYEPRPEPARGWLYGIAWNKLHEARRRGQADDAVRRELGMAPIALTDEGIARVEALAGGAALQLLPTAAQVNALPLRLRAEARRQALRSETLFYFLGSGSGSGGPIGSAPVIGAGAGLVENGGGVQAGRRLPLQLILVVPDGVQSVAFTIAQSGGDRVHRVPVRNNVATLQVRVASPTNPRQIVWYGAHGTILRRYSPPAGTG